MSIGHQALVQDPYNADAVVPLPVEYDMSSMFHTPQSGTHRIAVSAQSGSIRKLLEASLQIAKVTPSLLFTPGSQSVFKDGFQIDFRQPR